MTFAQACLRVAQYAQSDLDLYTGDDFDIKAGEDVSPAAIGQHVNDAVRWIADRIQPFDPLVVLTLTAGEARYSLQGPAISKRVTRPSRFYAIGKGYFNGPPGRIDSEFYGRSPGFYSPMWINKQYPGWQGTAPGTPQAVIYLGRALPEIILWPTPDAAYVTSFASPTDHIYVEGVAIPNDLATDGSADDTELPIPIELHEPAVYLAAYKGRMPKAQEESAWRSLAAYRPEWERKVDEVRKLQAADAFGPEDEFGYTHPMLET